MAGNPSHAEQKKKAKEAIQELYEDPKPQDAAPEPEKQPEPEPEKTPEPEPVAAAKPEVEENLNIALKREREERQRRERQWEEEKAAQQAEIERLREESGQIRKQQEAIQKAFQPEPTVEELMAQQEEVRARKWLEQESKPLLDPVSKQVEELRQAQAVQGLQMSMYMAQMAHPDLGAKTGWNGSRFDSEHEFSKYLLSSPGLQEQINKSPNIGEAVYQAARNWELSKPGAYESALQAALAAEREKFEKELQAKYGDILAKQGQQPATELSSIASISGGPEGRVLDDDDIDPMSMKAQGDDNRALKRQRMAELYQS